MCVRVCVCVCVCVCIYVCVCESREYVSKALEVEPRCGHALRLMQLIGDQQVAYDPLHDVGRQVTMHASYRQHTACELHGCNELHASAHALDGMCCSCR